ncbi:MAG: DNA repair protein RadA [Rhodospirillales bacterium]|nr:DNA repair protein RadA [Rhodospirillales bacterium]
MAKAKTLYVCQHCGTFQPKWTGQCPACNEWNSLVEEQPAESAPKGLGARKGRKIEFVGLKGEEKQSPRRVSGNAEFDRVTGGGLVPGSATLVGGDPGIGKSTLLMQIAAALSGKMRCAYISGEEAIDQLRLRAARLELADALVGLAAATSVRDIAATLEGADAPGVVVIDSIQCMYVDSIESAPGTVSQVRTSAQELIRLAKRAGFALILVGHVTKEGTIAGPRVLEHMVDTVLYFEGDPSHQFRILRSVKNRFGPADEIGVFEMMETGLHEVPNPSALFLSDHRDDVSGASVFAGMEGTRPMLVEIQSLIAPSSQATPRRAVVGWDSGRLAMIMAVLEARCGVALGGTEVYLNVAGGLKITEPAADMAVAAALISSVTGTPLPPETVVFGEVGLAGEARAVSQTDARLKEAEKLGFSRAIIPKARLRKGRAEDKGKKAVGSDTSLIITEIDHLADLVAKFPNAEQNRVSGPATRASSEDTRTTG